MNLRTYVIQHKEAFIKLLAEQTPLHTGQITQLAELYDRATTATLLSAIDEAEVEAAPKRTFWKDTTKVMGNFGRKRKLTTEEKDAVVKDAKYSELSGRPFLNPNQIYISDYGLQVHRDELNDPHIVENPHKPRYDHNEGQ